MTRITATPPVKKFYGSFYDTASTQYAASAQVAAAMSCNSTLENFGVVMNSSSIMFQNTGVYDIQFSAQFVGTKIADIYVWLRRNGTDVPWTNSKINIDNQNSAVVAAWNFVQTFNANDVAQVMWAVSDIDVHIQSSASTVNYPAIPGVIVTVTEI